MSPPDPLEEARDRLDRLEHLPLAQHPEEFSTIDRLLRSALEGAGGPDGVPPAVIAAG
jgi:hypothetical protein